MGIREAAMGWWGAAAEGSPRQGRVSQSLQWVGCEGPWKTLGVASVADAGPESGQVGRGQGGE